MNSASDENTDNSNEIAKTGVVIGEAAELAAAEAIYRARRDEETLDWRPLAEAANFPEVTQVQVLMRRLASLPDLINAKNYRAFAKRNALTSGRGVNADLEQLRRFMAAIEFTMQSDIANLLVPSTVEPLFVGLARELAPDGIQVFSDLEYELAIAKAEV